MNHVHCSFNTGGDLDADHCIITVPKASQIQAQALRDPADAAIIVRSSGFINSFKEDGSVVMEIYRLLNEAHTASAKPGDTIDRLAQLYTHGIHLAARTAQLYMHRYLMRNTRDRIREENGIGKVCALCRGGADKADICGPLVGAYLTSPAPCFLHLRCARASPSILQLPLSRAEAQEGPSSMWVNVSSALSHAINTPCASCHQTGASIPCHAEAGCINSYHYECATHVWNFEGEGPFLLCPSHQQQPLSSSSAALSSSSPSFAGLNGLSTQQPTYL